MTTEALVVFTPSGRQGHVPIGSNVLFAARSLGVDLDSVCGGRGLCGRCQVQPALGTHAKHGIEVLPGNLSPPGAMEKAYHGRRPLEDRRLGCAAKVLGDLVIDVPAESQVHRQIIRKRVEVEDIELDPVFRLAVVDVPEPSLDHATGEAQALLAALAEGWGIEATTIEIGAVAELQAALADGRRVTVGVRDDARVVAVWPGFVDRVCGLAVDVGSTTIAGYLADLITGEQLASGGVMNPQIRFGEDLMSRVSYVMMNPGGEVELTAAVRTALAGLVVELASDAEIEPTEIVELVAVGNPIMHHLLLGLDPTPLGGAPFALATDSAVEVNGAELADGVHAAARLYVLPCIAGHVGADTAAAIVSEAPHHQEGVRLLVDVGTNAEIVLGGSQRLLAASSPTGPAFEGAQISAGQRATAGAIERVRIDRETLEPVIKVIGSEAWSNEPAFAADVIDTGVTGICGSGIIEVIAELFLAGVVDADGVIDGAFADRSDRIVADDRTFSYVLHTGPPELRITQNDVRAIQLAKAALYAGARLLMDRLEVDEVDSIRLAGAFGSHIDPLYAMTLGLIPDCDLDRVDAAGNAAGAGALECLLSGKARREIERVVRRVDKIETATEASFQTHFVDAMALPHRTAPSPNLARSVQLPPRPDRSVEPGGGRRRRGRRRSHEPTGEAASTGEGAT